MTDDVRSFWENHYAARQVWSGRPNAALVDQVAALHPGRALDLGCGEGADAIWLATRGWDVTAVDVAATALERAREAAANIEGADRIRWIASDLATWQPEATYDLITASFLQSPVELDRTTLLRRAAAHVAPGGHLLLVSHAAPPSWVSDHHAHDDEAHDDHAREAEAHDHVFLRATDEVGRLALPAPEWRTVVAEDVPRDVTAPDGSRAQLLDSVVLLERG